MSKLFSKIRKFVAGKEEGASMAEYALLLFLVTAALVLIITAFGAQIGVVIDNVTTSLGG